MCHGIEPASGTVSWMLSPLHREPDSEPIAELTAYAAIATANPGTHQVS